MTSRQQWGVVGSIVAFMVVAAFAASHFLKDELTSVSVGGDAPGFTALTMPSADGAPRTAKTLSDYRGDVVLLNIWATWCGPCKIEMPSIEALQQAMAPKGLKVVAVSVDEPGDEKKIEQFVREMGLTFEILHDSTSAIRTLYRTTGVPETFVIARDGTIRKKWIGPEDWSSRDNQKLIANLLAESRP